MKIKLYRQFRHWFHGGTVFVFSDLNFWKSGKNRLYSQLSNEDRLRLINSKIGKKDTLVFLGNVGNDLNRIGRIRCQYKVLIAGPGDNNLSKYKKRYKAIGYYNAEDYPQLKDIPHEETDSQGCLLYSDVWHNSIEEAKAFNDLIDKPIGIDCNNLFDEIYEGPVFLYNDLILSCAPLNIPNIINIHGNNYHGTVDNKGIGIDLTMGIYPARLDWLVTEYRKRNKNQ